MNAKDYYDSYYKNNEKRQDERLENSMQTFNNMFENNDQDLSDKDPLEDTQDIKKIELLELKELLAKRYEEKETEKEETSSEEKGKVLKKALPGRKMSEDVEQIVTSFISCFVLALVTASIGAGWLLYIINNI